SQPARTSAPNLSRNGPVVVGISRSTSVASAAMNQNDATRNKPSQVHSLYLIIRPPEFNSSSSIFEDLPRISNITSDTRCPIVSFVRHPTGLSAEHVGALNNKIRKRASWKIHEEDCRASIAGTGFPMYRNGHCRMCRI